MLVLSLAVRWLECTLHIGMSLMLMITMVKNLRSMSEGFGWQRYKKYLYQSLSCREIAFSHNPPDNAMPQKKEFSALYAVALEDGGLFMIVSDDLSCHPLRDETAVLIVFFSVLETS